MVGCFVVGRHSPDKNKHVSEQSSDQTIPDQTRPEIKNRKKWLGKSKQQILIGKIFAEFFFKLFFSSDSSDSSDISDSS